MAQREANAAEVVGGERCQQRDCRDHHRPDAERGRPRPVADIAPQQARQAKCEPGQARGNARAGLAQERAQHRCAGR